MEGKGACGVEGKGARGVVLQRLGKEEEGKQQLGLSWELPSPWAWFSAALGQWDLAVPNGSVSLDSLGGRTCPLVAPGCTGYGIGTCSPWWRIFIHYRAQIPSKWDSSWKSVSEHLMGWLQIAPLNSLKQISQENLSVAKRETQPMSNLHSNVRDSLPALCIQTPSLVELPCLGWHDSPRGSHQPGLLVRGDWLLCSQGPSSEGKTWFLLLFRGVSMSWYAYVTSLRCWIISGFCITRHEGNRSASSMTAGQHFRVINSFVPTPLLFCPYSLSLLSSLAGSTCTEKESLLPPPSATALAQRWNSYIPSEMLLCKKRFGAKQWCFHGRILGPGTNVQWSLSH